MRTNWLMKTLFALVALAGFGIAPTVHAQTVEYVHTDALGSVVAMTDAAGNVIERNEYEPYGYDLTGAKDGPGYTGHVSDAVTGVTYMQQRYYDPQLGQFLSVDPVVVNPQTARGFNRYRYAASNPYKFTDPDGRKEYDCRKGGSCSSEIKVADLKPGDIVHTPGAMVTVSRSGDIRVGFKEGTTNGRSAARSGPILVPKGPAYADVGRNMAAAENMSTYDFYKAVKNKGPWDYKQDKRSDYEAFGNFNYGATGRAVGFAEAALLQAAGAANWRARPDGNPAIFGGPGLPGVPGAGSFGDDPVDQYWIQQGIRYHDAHD